MREHIFNAYHSYNNFDMFIQRGKYFEKAGRIHDLDQSKEIDAHLHAFLKEQDIFYGTYTHSRIDTVMENIQRSLKYNKSFNEAPNTPTIPKQDTGRKHTPRAR